jgi:aryl-alcohol dehydrogenase-like predicted oxidoreductase
MELVRHIEAVARSKGCSPAQLALAWVLARGPDVVPVFGTKRRSYLDENLKALAVDLSAEDLAEIDRIAPKGVAAGTRYPEILMHVLDG